MSTQSFQPAPLMKRDQVSFVAWWGIGGFTVLAIITALLTPVIQARFYPLLPDQGPAWYYWKLPESTTLIRISYWGGYIVHQVVVWAMFFAGRRSVPAPGQVNKFHRWMLGLNLLFVGLHLVQTYFFYDGLAQDVPIWTSQGSVIIMLVLVLYMMIPKRGLFFGRRFDPPARLLNLTNKWHGIIISWALVYTFWFHPMEGNWGMLSGFIYMFLLFIQMSLFNTSLHLNKVWIVLLEVFVAVHGTLVTVYKGNAIWPMFLFGFLIMFVVTQMHTPGIPKLLRVVFGVSFLVAVVGVYTFIRGWDRWFELTFIPVALYGGAMGMVLVGWIWEKLVPVRE